VIGQCEFGPGSTPGRVRQMFGSWQQVSGV